MTEVTGGNSLPSADDDNSNKLLSSFLIGYESVAEAGSDLPSSDSTLSVDKNTSTGLPTAAMPAWNFQLEKICDMALEAEGGLVV